MNNKIDKTTYITNIFFYTSMPLLRGLLSILILPILTRYLSPADYGTISIITMVTTFGWMFCLGLDDASYRFYFKYKNDIDKLRNLLSTNLIFIVISLIFYCFLISIFFSPINNYFFKGQLKIIWILLASLQFSLVYINTVNQDILKIKYEGKRWFLNEFIAIIIMVALSIILVVTRIFTFEAIIIANLVAELVKCFLIYTRLREYYALTFKFCFLKESLFYSWPRTPASILGFVCSYFDKALLSRLRGLSQVGILNICSKISLPLKMNMDGISGVFSPVTLELLTENTKESLKKLADICLKVVFLILSVSLSIILFSKELIILLTTKEYHFAIYIAPIYIYYHIFGVLGMVAYWLIYYHPQKTFWRIPINIIGLAANVVMNIILIPRYGLVGAAIAIFLSTGLTQVIQFIIGIRITPIPLNIFKLSIIFLALFIETAILYFLYYLNLNMYINITIKLLMLLSFIIFGLISKMFDYPEIKEIITMFKNKVKNRIFAQAIQEKNIADSRLIQNG